MYEVAIRHIEWIDLDEEVLQARPMISMTYPYLAHHLSLFYPPTYRGDTPM
jgi:hypothetical protein